MPKIGMVNEEKWVSSVGPLVSESHPFRDNYIPQRRQNNDLSQGLRVLGKTKPVL